MWNQDDTRNSGAQPRDAQRTGADAADARSPHFGRSVSVKGEVNSSEDLMIDGQVDGRIDLPDHALTVGPNAMILADITVRVATIFGTVVGTITAREKVDVRKSGSVEGQVTCARLVVQDGAILNGKVDAQGERRGTKTDIKAA